MRFICTECGTNLNEESMMSTKDGELYCPECFQDLSENEDKNIIQKVYEEMSTDSDGNDKQAKILENEYYTASLNQQKAIDRVFIALCGWSLKTLIEGHEATENYNPYA